MAMYYLNNDGSVTKKKKSNDVQSSGGFGAKQEVTLPTSNTNNIKKKKWYEEIVEAPKSNNILKNIVGTGVDLGQHFVKGAQNITESAIDLPVNGISIIANKLGFKDTAKDLRNFAQKDLIKENDLVNKTILNTNPITAPINLVSKGINNLSNGYQAGDLLNTLNPLGKTDTLSNKMNKLSENNSYSGNTLDSISEGAGYYAGMSALGGVGVPWQATAGVTSGASEMNNAFQNNATDEEAILSSLLSSGVEIGSEYLFNGIKLPGTGKTADRMITGVTSKIKNKGLKYLVEGGFNLAGEGVEEVISGIGTAIGQKLTYMKDKDLKELYSSEDALRDFVMGAAVTFVTGASNPGTYQNIKTGRSLINGLTIEEQNEVNKAVQEKEIELGRKLTNKEYSQVENNTIEKIQEEDISTNENINTTENTNPLQNLQEYNQKQQEIRNQQQNEEVNRRLNTLEEQLEKQGTRILEEAESQKQAMTENFKQYLEENNITNPTQNDINNSITDLLSYDNDLNIADTARAEQLYNQYVREYMQEKGIPFNNGNTEYRGSHQIENAKRLVDLNVNDIQSKVEAVNGYLTQQDQADLRKLHKIFNHPEEDIKVYRAAPVNELNSGDWITTDKAYAKNVAQNNGGKVYEYTIKPSQLYYPDNINDLPSLHRLSSFQYIENQPIIPTARDFNQVKLPTVENTKVAKNLLTNNNEKIQQQLKQNSDGRILGYKSYVNFMANVFENNINYSKLDLKTDNSLIKQYNQNANELLRKLHNQISSDNLTRTMYLKNENTNQMEKVDLNVLISLGNIKHSMNYGVSNQKLTLIPYIDELINTAPTGVIAEENKNRLNNEKWYYLYNSVNLDNDLYGVKIDIKKTNQGDRFQVHRVNLINEKGTSIQEIELDNSRYTVEQDVPSVDNDTTTSQKSQISLPTYNMQQNENNIPTRKVMNPNEISKLTKEDANTTPLLPKVNRNNKNATEESSFYKNATEKSKFLTEESRELLKDEESIKYYEGISNDESLNRAKDRLDRDGASETLRWFQQDSKKASSTDIAEGWILLKQYQDAGDYDSMVEVAKKMREIGTNAGQTVQAFNIMSRLTPEGMVKYAQSELSEAFDVMSKNKTREWIEKYRDDFELKPDEVQFIVDNMKEIQNMEDGYDKKVKLAEIQKLMTDKLPAEKGKGIKAWMRISMLFNPKTQVRNVSGNALIMPINSFGDLFSSYADKIIAKKTGVRTTGKTNIKAILKGMKKGAYEATNDYKKGINTRDMEGNRFEIGEGKSFNDKTAIGKGLNRVDRLLNYVMDAGDRIFSEAAFENSLQNQMVLNNTTEITQDMIDIAHQEALSRTWNDNNEYTKFVLGVRRGLNKIGVNGYGLGDVLIPFAKTPANLTKAIVDYSPAGMIKTIVEGNNLRKSLSNGQYTPQMQHKFVQDLGKATAGTMLYVLGYALAKAGITSGESDDDKDVANFMRNTLGVNSYSIKIGGKTFTYDWAQPLAAPLSITSNIVNKQKEDATLYDSILSSLDTAGNILLEQSFLESLNTALNNNKGIATGIQEAIMELPSRSIPTFAKQLVDLTDGTQRQTFEYNKPLDTAINKVKAKIPGLSQTLAPSVDTMGREIKKQGGKNNLFNVFLNPANVSTENISESAKEIYRLYQETGDTTIMPRVAPYYINKGEKITLNSQQREEFQKISGDIVERSVQELLKNSKYKNMSDEDKADVINKIVNYSYNKAQHEVLGVDMSNQYNKINQYVEDGGKASNYYLNKEEIDYSYNNPNKYATIKQITNYDDYKKYNQEIENIKNKYSTTNERKRAVINYINSLNMNIAQKAMLIKQYYSFKNYDKEIVKYINSQKLTQKEKEQVLTQLGFTVKDGRVYY